MQTIPQLISTAAERYGQRVFLEEGELTLSFADFARHSRRLAAALIASGIQRGDRIAVWAPNIYEWVVAALGVQTIGAILVTLNTRYKGSEAAAILRRSRARLLFSIGNFLDTDYPAQLQQENTPELAETVVFRQTETKLCRWQDFLQRGDAIEDAVIDEHIACVKGSDTADILFTSGTTGSPKGVKTAQAQNLKAFTIFSDILGLQQHDRYLVINPFFHSFGYKAGILACLIRGVSLLPHAVFDAGAILKRIAADRISVLPGPPTLFQSLLAHPQLGEYDISSLRAATTGAAAIPVELIQQMQQTLGFERVITAYGLTESCGLVSMCRQSDSPETIARTSGRAIPDIELRCVDNNNRPVAVGAAGEIVVRGFNVMQGYFEDPQATVDTIDADGWLHTGDIGILDEQGNLRITDRLKDMFISGGFNCYPAEIENTLAGHPAIAMSAVIGVPDKRLGEVPAAFVVLKPQTQLTTDDLVNWCRNTMANYKVPQQVHFVEALPLNAAGKVLKTELRKQI